jgi:hypothetical protein
MAEEQSQGNIKQELNSANIGLNLDNTLNQIKQGTLTYALNAALENFDSSSVNYQNEQGNELCLQFPEEYVLIGTHFINEQSKHIFFLTNPNTGDSEIGYMDNNDCVYNTLVSALCLNFNVDHPIHKTVHRITNCTTEIYWTDGFNPRRYLDINDVPYLLAPNSDLCNPTYTTELDCNQLKLQPNFNIPNLSIVDITTGGSLLAGTYQFAAQYTDASGNPYTSYYSVTNPTPIANPQLTTPNFNYQVGKSIVVNVSNLDATGQFQYFNLAVIKTVNTVTSVELIGTYFIDETSLNITYTGQMNDNIRLSINDIFEKFPYYDVAEDLTAVQDVLVWDGLTSIDRINYQSIANQINLLWETYRIPATENYADELNATNLRGYLRDEVYAFEIVFLLNNGKQTDGFHIPGRKAISTDLVPVSPTNADFIGEPDPETNTSPYWKIYNTADAIGESPSKSLAIDYKGPWEYGRFAYWESTELYPCNEAVWGELSGKPIRHYKFPDIAVSPAFESKLFTSSGSMVMGNDAVFPIGVRIGSTQIATLIETSNLTQEQKDDIVAYKIVRGDRGTNKSIVAKGILRNVGKYNREGTDYYYPNYPYNDLREDPFILDKSNAFTANAAIASTANDTCRSFTITAIEDSTYEYSDCSSEILIVETITAGETVTFCAINLPIITFGKACMYANTYDRYSVSLTGFLTIKVISFIQPFGLTPDESSPNCDFCNDNPTLCPNAPITTGTFDAQITVITDVSGTIYIRSITPPYVAGGNDAPGEITIEKISSVGYGVCTPLPLKGFEEDGSKYRHVFNSPETSFGQPFLGDYLKLENVIFGAGRAHYTQVKNNAMYRLLTKEAQQDALESSSNIASNPFNATALFTAYQSYLTIYVNGITRRNYAYSYNSIADYNYNDIIENNLGIKQRPLDIARYIIPGVQSVGDNHVVNNWNRESSVYLKTKESITPLPFPDKTPSIAPGGLSDESRFSLSDYGCNKVLPEEQKPISVVSYYASIKNIAVGQWGQMYSYETLDTGFQRSLINIPNSESEIFFGGDTFISRFAFKTKLPFFIDNRVNAPDDSDIFFDEIGNVAYPKYWHSARSILITQTVQAVSLTNFISIKAHNLECPNSQEKTLGGLSNSGRTFYDGKMYLFAYGIPNFYCETSYNTDLRQAFNNKEGDFWPHVSTDIPDDWLQESNVTILQDNTYYYNVTFSKQNKENFFSHLPPDWEDKLCYTNYPFRAIYSEAQSVNADNRVNSWLIYRPIAAFDFPQNYGKLVSLDGIQNKAVLARFENKTLMYNNLLTIDTSNPQAAYVGNPNMFKGAPPIDFAETDLGYVGSQNKMLLKIPQGQLTVDAKRGQVFLIQGTQVEDLSAFGSGMNRFFTDHLAFEILRYFPDHTELIDGKKVLIKGVDTDNNFNGIGLHGVYDSKFDRVILTKLDYIPLSSDIKYDPVTKDFYTETPIGDGVYSRTVVSLKDSEYFCNKSWTLSFNVNTKSWISFHSYIPNWYIAENNFFYSGINGCCDDFDFIAGPLIAASCTTSTSTSTSTTTSTTTILNCSFILNAEEITSTTTTTSTSTTSTSSTTTTTTTADPCAAYTIGQSALGGIIAYILKPGDPGYVPGECHGLVASPSEFNQAVWGCEGLDIFQAEGSALGTGLSNSIAIENGCPNSGAAAVSCLAKVYGIYNDWYLPSQGELYKLYLNRVAIGGFSSVDYWSSTQQDSTRAYMIPFSNGIAVTQVKSQAAQFRPIRSF